MTILKSLAGLLLLALAAAAVAGRRLHARDGAQRQAVWDAVVGQGAMRFAGSDGYHRANGRETSWTKFWLGGAVPLVRVGDTPDHARAAATRMLLESLWAPAYAPFFLAAVGTVRF